VRTAIDDLRGVARLAMAGPVLRFMGVGVLSTIAYALLYLGLHGLLGAGGANAAALGITAVANTAANRRLTFGLRGRAGLAGHHARGALVYVLTLGLTTLALASLHRIDAAPSRAVELAVLVVAGAAATVTRYIALRTWVFAAARRARKTQVEGPALETTGR
jgi:putative flippase GtrA